MISPLEAATMIAADYANVVLTESTKFESLDIRGVQASIWDHLDERVLLVRGTDQGSDWLRYDFDFLICQNTEFGDKYKWHAGFLHYAQVVYAFAKGKGVTLAIGHSLGAAAVQIVAPSLNVPGMAFASPRPLAVTDQPINSTNVRNFCRPDDLVTMLPPSFLGFYHVGVVNWLTIGSRHIGEDHRIAHYLELLSKDDLAHIV